MIYPWYENLHDCKEIEQGDIILDCPIIVPPITFKEDDVSNATLVRINSIVLSQSCDIINDKIEIVIVCPYKTLSQFLESFQEKSPNKKEKKKIIDNLRTGHYSAYHLLNKDDNMNNDYLVVDFRNIYGIHVSALKAIVSNTKDRIRLLPPYREHLSQAFARFFMRVGLPQDIDIESYFNETVQN